ncbi:MAG: class I SAM-dependent methyltransferase [Promethearchaeota archaeon]
MTIFILYIINHSFTQNNSKIMETYYYNKIASDYNSKRNQPWISLGQFLNGLYKKGYRFNGFCLDLGCGNGRNFKLFKKNMNNRLIGIDNSFEFIKIAQDRIINSTLFSKIEQNNIQLILGDIKYIPVRAYSVQNIFSIATIHHIKYNSERKRVIHQINNLLTKNGYFLLTVWRRWQKKLIKYFIKDWFNRTFKVNYKRYQRELELTDFGDKFVPWTVSAENKTYNRFYHFFSKREIKNLINRFKMKEFRILGGSTNKDNFFILTQKTR